MDKIDKAKLRVLIKMILIQKSPKYLTSKQLADIINKYNWGFRTNISSAKIGKLMSVELNKKSNHFMDCIQSRKRKNDIKVYRYHE